MFEHFAIQELVIGQVAGAAHCVRVAPELLQRLNDERGACNLRLAQHGCVVPGNARQEFRIRPWRAVRTSFLQLLIPLL